MNKKFVYQVGNNKKVILWCTANQISTKLKLTFSHAVVLLFLSTLW